MFSTEEKFDAIVVGAGPAGCSCAYKLAQAGLQVLLVEKGKFAGAKNMWGGVLFGSSLGEIIPDFPEGAPIERRATRHIISFLSGESAVNLEFRSARENRNAYIILRAGFDKWFARKVEQAGAIVATQLKAEDLLWHGGRVVGVKAGGDELPADVVVACDGVNSILAQKAGLRTKLSPMDVKLGVKEVIELPRITIEQRFNLAGDEGVAWEFLGECTKGIPGGGFLYTNKESISLGVVVQLGALIKNQASASEIIDDFKSHPVVRDLIDGGKVVEYSAHMIPTSGLTMMPSLYTDGLLVAGDAAALVLGTGLILEGANFAIASGVAAAEAIKTAKQAGDFSKETLACYQALLEDSFVLEDLRTFKRASHFLENPRIYTSYPDIACSVFDRIYARGSQRRESLWQIVRGEMRGRVSLWHLIVDLLRMKRAL